MIWLKRLLPFVILGATAFGYYLWDKSETEKKLAERDRIASLTARIWVATATFRDDPERYLAYRDSLIQAAGLSRDEVYSYVDQFQNDPERLLPLSELISQKIDSLYQVEDSLYREARIRAHDSVREAARSNAQPSVR